MDRSHRRVGDRVRTEAANAGAFLSRQLAFVAKWVDDVDNWAAVQRQAEDDPALEPWSAAGFVLTGVTRLVSVQSQVSAAHCQAMARELRLGIDSQIPALTLSRGVLESCCSLAHCLDATLTVRQLVDRALVDHLWPDASSETGINGTLDHRTNPIATAARLRHGIFLDDLTAASRQLGWEPEFAKKSGRFTALRRLDGDRASCRPTSMTKIITDLASSNGATSWALVSAATHGSPWMITHEVDSPDVPMPGATAVTATRAAYTGTHLFLTALGERFDDPGLRERATRVEDNETQFLHRTAEIISTGAPPSG